MSEHARRRPRLRAAAAELRLGGTGLLALTAAALMVCATMTAWQTLRPANPALTDFAPGYASALLLREGHPAEAYDQAAQRAVLVAATASGTTTTAPTALAPPALVVEEPLTLLPLWAANALWSALQLALLVLAAWITMRAVPRAHRIAASTRLLILVAAVCGGGTLMLLSLNQWDGIAAAGLALVYANLRTDRDARAMAWLVVTVLAGKPHLGLGIALFIAARRPRSVLAAVLVTAAVFGLTLLLLPASVMSQWISTVIHVGSLIPTATTIGLGGMTTSLLGTSVGANVIGFAASAVALAATGALGVWDRARQATTSERADTPRLELLFAGVTILSLLSASHVFPYDLVLLIPGFVATATWRPRRAPLSYGAKKRGVVVVALWAILTLACWAVLWPPGSYRTSPLLTLLPLGSAAGCAYAAQRRSDRVAVYAH